MRTIETTASRIAALALVLLATAGSAHAGANRPFKASIDAEEHLGRSTECLGDQSQPGLRGTLQGTGHATHMGTLQVSAGHCMQQRTDGSFYASSGRMVLTSASGEVLHADYAGFFLPAGGGTFTFEGNYFVTDGTGRFAGAGGTGALFGTVRGTFPSQIHGLSLSAEGRISY